MLEVRSSVYSKLCRIHGKLDLMNIHEQHDPAADGGAVLAEAVVSVTLGGWWQKLWLACLNDVCFSLR